MGFYTTNILTLDIYPNNKLMKISISGVNNDEIKKGISIIVNEIKD